MSLASPLTSPAEALLRPRLEQRILPGLERMDRALEALGHPDRAFPSVLIVGTNGKGSTAALLESVLRCHGLKTGLYTSPHLLQVEERIRVAGSTIPPDNLLTHLTALERFPDLSFFEALTCAGFLEFRRVQVDVAILEAGMGGRWDATNAASPVVSLLTNVGTDHQRWLGASRAAIAGEKAAALRGLAGIIGRWDHEVEAVIRKAADPGTPLSTLRDWVHVNVVSPAAPPPQPPDHSVLLSYRLRNLHGAARLPLAGAHQHENLSLALAGAAALAHHAIIPPLQSKSVDSGISSIRWPGRLQWLSWQGRSVLLDGAHNREAMKALVAFLDHQELSGRIHIVFSCLEDKSLSEMAELLRPRAAGVTVTRLESPRAMDLSRLAAAFPGCEVADNPEEALRRRPVGETILITGSLRLVGDILHTAKAHHE